MRKPLFNLVISLLTFSCTPFEKVSQEIRKGNKKEAKIPTLFIAIQKDTLGGIFIFHEENFFSYSVNPTQKKFKQKYYAGQYRNGNDTIFLSFYKNHKPDEMAEYLLKDISRKNLIYPLKSYNRNIIFEIKYKDQNSLVCNS